MTFIKPIIGVFAVAGMTIVLTGCDDLERYAALIEGKKTPDQIAAESAQDAKAAQPDYSQGSLVVAALSAPESEPVVEVVAEAPAAPPPEPVCEPWDFRQYRYDCHGQIIGPNPYY